MAQSNTVARANIGGKRQTALRNIRKKPEPHP